MHHLHRQTIAALLDASGPRRAREYGERQNCLSLAETMIREWFCS